MRCSRARKLFSPYIDKELTKAEKELFDAHIRDCTKCQIRLKEMHALHDTFSYMKSLNAPYGFVTRVMSRAENENSRRSFSIFPIFATLAETLIVIGIIVIGIKSGSFIGKTFMNQKTALVASLSLDTFEAVQPNSIGGAYIAMMDGQNEK
ncbi:MAG: zf-HC2 domain-containing protein [Deltaproteobacteria bacterium]|nr:zf-HC2 domain-containing protein [Deltaproteobacteria bacterium]